MFRLQANVFAMSLGMMSASVAVGCAIEEEELDTGTARMGVVGSDAAGNIYRLRDATFTLVGPTEYEVSSESSATPVDSIALDVSVGSYTVTLLDGWRLERFDPATETAVDVAATLAANPLATDVSGGATSQVVFLFYVDGAGPVDLDQGTIDIDIDVQEPPPELVACDPLSPACPGSDICVYAYEQEFVCAPPLDTPAGPFEPCEFLNACEQGLVCVGSQAISTCDQNALGCCAPLCLSAGDCTTGTATACATLGSVEYPDLGVCITP